MWNRAFEAQSRLLELYSDMIHATTASITTALQNTERLQRRQIDLMREAIQQHGELTNRAWDHTPVSDFFTQQTAQTLHMWRAFVHTAQETQEATYSAVQSQADRTADTIKTVAEDAASSAMAAAQKAWSGQERRTAIITPYSGIERRKAA